MARELRQPPPQVEFDAIAIPTPVWAGPLPRVRLANPSYASQFFANPASRLTPVSGNFPCVYLGANKQTAIAEVWGDRFWLHRSKGGGVFSIVKSVAQAVAFLEAPVLPVLKLCDLTHGDVRMALGLEGGTLYSPQLALPQTWAERVARHPLLFDGIVYRSRITDEPCLLLWLRPGGRALDQEISFSTIAPFLNAPEAYQVAAKCGLRLAFI